MFSLYIDSKRFLIMGGMKNVYIKNLLEMTSYAKKRCKIYIYRYYENGSRYWRENAKLVL